MQYAFDAAGERSVRGGRGAGRADRGLRWRSGVWSNKRSCDSRFSGTTCLAGGMTRITSPAGTQSMSSPGWIPYSSAIFLGTVTWYLDVTFAIRLSGTRVYAHCSKDQILVATRPWNRNDGQKERLPRWPPGTRPWRRAAAGWHNC